jgi:hypothetical protein
LHKIGLPPQVPLEQTSVVVQSLLSSQSLVFGAKTQTPDLQLSSVHGLASSHGTVVWVHLPAEQ